MEQDRKGCNNNALAQLLLEPSAASAQAKRHMADCDPCQRELAELEGVMGLLDSWKGPEPNPYFMSRFQARLREEREAQPTSWLARLRMRFASGSHRALRPMAAMALMGVLLVGGGAYVEMSRVPHPAPQTGQAAVVHDLQTLDKNAQLLDQLEAMSNAP